MDDAFQSVIATGAEASNVQMARTRGVTKNSELARRKLLDAAYQLFSRQGFKATSTEQIAGRAGYSQAAIFFHFGTKAGLLNACLEEALERAKESIPMAERQGTISLLGALDDAFDDHDTAELFARMMLEQSRSVVIQPIYAAFHAHIRDLICTELKAETGADADRCATSAATILSMMIGVHAEYRVENSRFDRADYRAMLLGVATLVIASLKSAAAADAVHERPYTPP